MRFLVVCWVFCWPGLVTAATAVDGPDFESWTARVAQVLEGAGDRGHAGDRSELIVYSDDGWEMQLLIAFNAERWQLLALRLHHPERAERSTGQWQERYTSMLKRFRPEWLAQLEAPELIDVPPPNYLPAVPQERRSRRFTHQGYWYEVRWFNSGGLDELADWSLISYDLVLEPPDDR